MAKVAAHPTRVYFDEFDVSGFLNSTKLSIKQETIPVATFVDTGPRRLVGNHDHESEHMGLLDGASGQFDAQAFVDLATDEDHFLCQCFGHSAVEGSVAHSTIKRLREQPRMGASGGAVLLNLIADGSGGMSRGLVLRNAAVTAIGNGTGRNQGVTVAGVIYQAVFRVLAVSGAGSITVIVEESQNDGGADPYAAIAGLTATFTAVGVSRVTTTAATEAWKRIRVSAFSGFTSVTVLVTAGVVQNSA